MECKTILLVDDDRDVRSFIGLLLERAGYAVLIAGDGEEGLRLYQLHRSSVALLLTDLRMPKMNGLDLAHRVLQIDSKLPVLFMSGDGRSSAGAYDCIEKPAAPAEVIRRVEELLSPSERGRGDKGNIAIAS